ncbi:MAG: penicillin-binding protein 2, partial [Chloroflexota bacterium]|nr:penicillin-binding protein 2 [Chloroflexota bacterium]
GEAERIYPYPLLAPVTGHWTLLYGKSGLERSFDDFLNGRRGQQGLDAFDEIMHETVVGADVVTTIQPRLQVAADQLLGDRAGAIIVMDPESGAILALASRPTYDPNTYTENAEEIVDHPNQPLLNRVTQGLYTPGSVFKVVTLAGVLAQETVGPDELFPMIPYDEPGVFFVEGFPIREGSTLAVENAPFDLPHALAYSSNVAFAQLALELGPDGLREIARAFGFGEEPPLNGLPTEASRLGTDAFLLDQVGLANTGYGQGQLLVTPLQMALVTAAVANEGTVPEPRLVQEIRSREGDTLLTYRPRPWRRAISEDVAEQVKEAMVVAATDGFARAGKPEGITIGGKTGTAQLGGLVEPHAWFVAFAPAEEPEIVVAVLVENAGAGGDVAAPIARELIQIALVGE